MDNMPKLQENIQSRIDDEYKERIDLEEDEDSFYEVINAAIKVLAGGLQNRVTPKLEVRHRRAGGQEREREREREREAERERERDSQRDSIARERS